MSQNFNKFVDFELVFKILMQFLMQDSILVLKLLDPAQKLMFRLHFDLELGSKTELDTRFQNPSDTKKQNPVKNHEKRMSKSNSASKTTQNPLF